jgi:hypothetical protein
MRDLFATDSAETKQQCRGGYDAATEMIGEIHQVHPGAAKRGQGIGHAL